MKNIAFNNGTTLRDVYPTYPFVDFATTSKGSKTQNVDTDIVQEKADDNLSATTTFAGGLVFLGLVFAIMFIVSRFGEPDDFKSIKPSVYNVLVVSLMAATGLPLLKAIAIRIPIRPLQNWVMSA